MPTTRVTMVGHASALIAHGEIGILTDPWFSGAIFNDSWELLSSPQTSSLDGVTHIWISHEHPDHLHFPSLKMLCKSLGGRCTILVQRHRSREMFTALTALGFAQVVELPMGKWVHIGQDVEVICMPSRRIDSLLAVKTTSATILNLNDCKLGRHYAKQIAKVVGATDLLLAQFSIANRPDNKGMRPYESKRYRVARRTSGYAAIIEPKQLVLFGSFVWFCHKENAYMNDWALSPAQALEYLQQHCACAVALLYPGDSWSSDLAIRDTNAARVAYTRDWHAARERPVQVSTPVTMEEIADAGRRLGAQLTARVPAAIRRFFRPVLFYVDDHRQALRFDVAKNEIRLTDHVRGSCHIALNSQALWYAFSHRWGLDTLDISGRYDLINRRTMPAAIRLCDAYSSGLNLRRVNALFDWYFSVERLWCKRGEILDFVERRILGRKGL